MNQDNSLFVRLFNLSYKLGLDYHITPMHGNGVIERDKAKVHFKCKNNKLETLLDINYSRPIIP